MNSNLNSHAWMAEALNSKGQGVSTAVGYGNAEVFRYDDPESVKKHIDKLVHVGGFAKVISGIENLKKATGTACSVSKQKAEPNPEPQLRKGQIIFGTVSVAQAKNKTKATEAFFMNLLAPLLMLHDSGEARKYAYLHAAVYAGKHKGQDYVIENGGGIPKYQNIGMVSAVPMEEAFEKDARFFVISPPKDSRGKSTRFLVLQRALACLGTYFHYHMRSVNCEVFAMTMMRLEPKLEPIQMDVLKPSRGHEPTEVQRKADEGRFKKFHEALLQRLRWYDEDTVLTLDYYLNQTIHQNQKAKITPNCHDADKLNNACKIPWWLKMDQDYQSFAQAVKDQDLEKCKMLIEMGLNIHGKMRNESMPAIAYAENHGFTELKKMFDGHP